IPEPATTGPNDPNRLQLVGVDRLWKAHQAALAFLDPTGKLSPNRTNVLVATDFNTQTTTVPLDPAVATSPAATLATSKLAQVFSVPTATNPALACNAGAGCTTFMTAIGLPCSSLPCTAVGDILGAGLIQGASMYQVPVPNAFL